MTTLESNRCYACGKLFCCAKCCTEHIKKKHPGRESKCPLCRSERLKVKDFENEEFLCHIVFNHLPLHCHLCGKHYNNCDDLRNIGVCKPHRPLIQVTSATIEIKACLLSPEGSSPFNKTPCGISVIKRKEFSIGSDFNENFGNLTSPPELVRNTSTPMQVSLAANGNFKAPRSPSFAFKTPKAASIAIKHTRINDCSGVKENNIQSESYFKDSPISDTIYRSVSSPSDSAINDYRTPLRSILSNQSLNLDNSRKQHSRIQQSVQKLDAIQDINEEMGIEIFNSNMDFTGIVSNIVSDNCTNDSSYVNSSQQPVKERRDYAKKVRFSDQFEIKSDPGITTVSEFNVSTENEEFFEAQQSISEVYVVDKLSISALKLDTVQDIHERIGIEVLETVDMDFTDVVYNSISDAPSDENSSQQSTEEQNKFTDEFQMKSDEVVTSVNEFKDSTESEEFVDARQSISEMSVVAFDKLSSSATLINTENEKNFEKEVSKRDVLPKSPEIMDSNRQSTSQNSSSSSSRVVMMVVVEKNGTVNAADLVPLIDSSLKKFESITAQSGRSHENPCSLPPQIDEHGNLATTVISVDSYMSLSTVERFSTPNSTINSPQISKDSLASSNSGSGGIFSAMAQAMRTAFKNFSGSNSSKRISRELVSQQRDNPPLVVSSSDSDAATSSILTSLASSLAIRPAKRSRDELSPVQSTDPLNDVRSPVPKRPRGWYKIRAREPIARMRNNSVTLPRGVLSETQRFQQGLLSIGDTILPLPSRAHKSTQTD